MSKENPRYTYGTGVAAGICVMQDDTTATKVVPADGTKRLLGVVTYLRTLDDVAYCWVESEPGEPNYVTVAGAEWEPGAHLWVDSADGSITTTAQAHHDLWLGRAIEPDVAEVLRHDPDAEWPRIYNRSLTCSGTPAALAASATTYATVPSEVARAKQGNVEARVTFGATPDGNATVFVESSVDGGSNWATAVEYTQQITYGAAATKGLRLPVSGLAGDVRVGVTNGDSADTIAVVAICDYLPDLGSL